MVLARDSERPLRGAVIGCGFFALNQLHAWRDISGVDIVAICDRDASRLRLVGDEFGIGARYDDAAAMMVEQDLDFVDIATTPPSHRALVELAARNNVAIICQKPIAPTLEDAKAMVEAARAADVAFMIHENFRWQTPVLAVKQALAEGVIGSPFWGRVSFRSGFDVYASQPYLATGDRFIIEDLGIHILDIARFLMGDVECVTARTQRVNRSIKGEDVATMLLGHQGGVTSVVDCSYASPQEQEPFPETFIEIDGSLGCLRLTKDYQLTVTTRNQTISRNVAPTLPVWGSRPWHNIQESVRSIQQHWVDCLNQGTVPDTSGDDNLKTFALVQAAYLSAETGQTVKLSDL